MAKRKPYQESSDIKQLKSQWKILRALHSREKWQAAILQATAVVEIAANLVVRREIQLKSKLDETFVTHLLKWANGIVGKMDYLILPLFSGNRRLAMLKKQKWLVEKINEKRNAIIQRSKLCTEREATMVVNMAKTVVENLVKIYRPEFNLDDG